MSAICGICERGESAAEGVDGMLAALPGGGIVERWTHGAVDLGCREPAAEAGEGTGPPPDGGLPGLAIAADVRLDNRAQLSDALGIRERDRGGLADRALVLRAYRRWGRECPSRLLGDFAFAVWDAERNVLFCARDHIGARPFYYSLAPGRFTFASDVDAVLAAPGVSDDLDDAYVAAVLMRRMPGGAHTFFRAVRSLPPGHSLTVDANTERLERWWRPEDAPTVRHGSDDDYAGALLELCAQAVRARLRGAQPVGVHLSGGLDTSGVAVLAARELRRDGRPLQAFSWHPPPPETRTESEAAEYGLIEAVCAQEGLRPIYHAVGAGDVVAALRRDGAFAPDRDGTLQHEALVQRSAAERGVRVLLSGWGGDEGASFNGRGYHAQLLRRGRLARLYRESREQTERPLRLLLANAVLAQVHSEAPRLASRLWQGRLPRRRRTFVHPALARRAARPQESPRMTGVRQMQLALLGGGHLTHRIEDWAASGARHGIEYRYPLLDRRLLEFALGLPPEQFRRGRWNRWLMRYALQSVVPSEVCWNPSKRDPARFRPAVAALVEALPAIRGRLAARGEPPARAKYLDMPRLLARLDADAFRAHRQTGKLEAALRFLDW